MPVRVVYRHATKDDARLSPPPAAHGARLFHWFNAADTIVMPPGLIICALFHCLSLCYAMSAQRGDFVDGCALLHRVATRRGADIRFTFADAMPERKSMRSERYATRVEKSSLWRVMRVRYMR